METLISEKDLLEFQKMFQEKKQSPKEVLQFIEFVNIVKNAECIKEANIMALLETFKKELKAKTGIDNEYNLFLNESDYYLYLKQLVVAHNKAINEKDMGFSK